MGRTLTIIQNSGASVGKETLHINRKQSAIRASFNALSFIDKDTEQYVFYIPSLEVSGYGSTKAKALEMAKFSVDACFTHFMSLNDAQLHIELCRLGWKKTIFKKDFSHAFVDANGHLQGMNPVENSVERVTLEAA